MAKGNKDKGADGRSALEAALKAYEAGDVVTARRTAGRVIAVPTPEDQAAAKRVARQLHGEGDPSKAQLGFSDTQEAQAERLAQEIINRGKPILRPYLWFLGGATAYLLLMVMALVRYG
jgi:hypothetical protein